MPSSCAATTIRNTSCTISGAKRRLIKDQQPRIEDQGLGDRQHLLLAA